MKWMRVVLLFVLIPLVPHIASSHSELQWGREGLPVCTLDGNQDDPSAAPDGIGGAIVVWADDRFGTIDLYAQRVDSEAYLVWDPEGVIVSTRSTEKISPVTLPESYLGEHGIYVVWVDDLPGATSIVGQKMATGGTPEWGGDGVQLTGTVGIDTSKVAACLSDSAGMADGLLITWSDHLAGNRVSVQRADADGMLPWGASGVEVTVSGGGQLAPSVASDDAGGAIVVWEDFNIRAQRVDESGGRLWDDYGNEVAPSANSQIMPQVVRTATGDFIVAWTEFAPGADKAMMAKLLSDGSTEWGPIELPSGGYPAISPVMVPDETGGVICSYGRIGTNETVHAAQVDEFGYIVWSGQVGSHAFLDDPIQISRDAGQGTYFSWTRDDGGEYKSMVQYFDDQGENGLLSGGLDIADLVPGQGSPSLSVVAPCINMAFVRGTFDLDASIVGQLIFCVPNIEVQYSSKPTGTDSTALMNIISASGGYVQYVARYVNSIFLGKTKASLNPQILALSGVTAIVPQYPIKLYMDVSTRAMKARKSTTYSPNTAEDLGYDGTGVNVCIIDTGVDDGHPSLDDLDDSAVTVDPKFVAGYSGVTATPGNTDDDMTPIFHGTHCAGTAVGTGGGTLCGTPADSLYAGVAPQAGLVEVKVFPKTGALTGGTTGQIMRGMEWVLDRFRLHSIDVVSMSLGFGRICNGTQFYNTSDSSWKNCTICPLANAMMDSGIVVLVAAGNSGPDNTQKKVGLGCPGTADKVITVAAMHDRNTITRTDDSLSNYSSRGPRASDNDSDTTDEQKPEVSAIGGVGASLTKGTEAVWSTRGIAIGQNPGCLFYGISGTSMATPHVAGIAALMLEANPSLTPLQVKKILIDTAEDFGDAGWDSSYGYGMVDTYEACSQAEDFPTGDGEICQWPRDVFWWDGAHIVGDWIGDFLNAGVIVTNLGPGKSPDYDLSFYYSEPTVAGCVPGPNDIFVEMLLVPELGDGESISIDSILVPVPDFNSFGQKYWTLKAMIESEADPGSSKWPVEDNNVSVRSNWMINQYDWGGGVEDFYFWAENPEDETGYVTLDVVDSLLPGGFTVTLDPPAGTLLALDPGERTEIRLTPSAIVAGDTARVVVRAELDAGGGPPRTQGGIIIEYVYDSMSGAEEQPLGDLTVIAVPNPSHGRTRISYGLRKPSKVTLRVYDIQGRLARALSLGRKDPGRHSIVWDGCNEHGRTCSPGVYFIEVRAEGQSRLISTVLLR